MIETIIQTVLLIILLCAFADIIYRAMKGD